MAEPADINVDELRRRARRRLVGAVVLALGVAVVVPMLLETEQKPLGEDVSVKIPPVDSGRFVNRLNQGSANAGSETSGTSIADAGPAAAPANTPANDATPARAQKYDTRVPDPAAGQASGNGAGATTGNALPRATEPTRAGDAEAPQPPDSSRSTADTSKAGHESAEVAKPAEAKKAPSAERSSPLDAAAKARGAESARSAGAERTRPAAEGSTSAGGDAAKRPGEASKSADATKASSGESARTPTPPTHASVDGTKVGSSSHREGFAVQLAAFADDRGANSLAGRLKKAGYAAYTEPLKTSKGTLWRVRVGPYPSREAAVAARDKLKTEGQSGIVAAIK